MLQKKLQTLEEDYCVRCVAELQTSYIVRSLKWRRGVCADALRTCNHPSRRRPDLKYYEMMSRPWNPSLYRSMHNQSPPPDAVEVEGLMQAIEEFGERLRTQPYDTMAWLQRARCFLTINYPELAASDAYKASMLIDRETQTLSEDSDATRTKIYDVLGQALYDCHCHWELEEFWQDVASKHPSDHASKKLKDINELMVRKASAAVPAEYEHERRDRLRDGGVLTVDYPWLQEQHRVRSPELVEAINQELTHSNGDRVCYLASSTLAPASDMLGIFAARNLEKGETILVDRTAMAACSNPDTGSCSNCFGLISTPVETKCCSAIYCASECRDVALSTYHKTICGQDFSWLQSPARGLHLNASPLRPLLMLRIIATAVQSGTHPLSHPLIARLQPLSKGEHMDVFTFNESIKTPIAILQQLGIDVFTSPQLDTMTLHTVWTRLANNKAGSPDPKLGFVDEITPHLPLFNHSCEPNAGWRREEGSTTIHFFTKSAVQKGEELFSSYIDTTGMALETRVAHLWDWFEGECLCSRCERERELPRV
jgi:hypothetical protein